MSEVANDIEGRLGRTGRLWCQKRIDALIEAHAAISGVLICSADGFEIVTCLDRSVPAATLSAMTSSQVALGEAISNACRVGPCLNAVIEADLGWVLMMDVPNRKQKLLLTAIAESGALLGQVLWAVRQCAQEIGERLDRSSHD